jgi:hypothetical protein
VLSVGQLLRVSAGHTGGNGVPSLQVQILTNISGEEAQRSSMQMFAHQAMEWIMETFKGRFL